MCGVCGRVRNKTYAKYTFITTDNTRSPAQCVRKHSRGHARGRGTRSQCIRVVEVAILGHNGCGRGAAATAFARRTDTRHSPERSEPFRCGGLLSSCHAVPASCTCPLPVSLPFWTSSSCPSCRPEIFPPLQRGQTTRLIMSALL